MNAADPIDHASDLRRLAEMASRPQALADVLRGALASLRDVVPYDLAAVYELERDELRLRLASGPLADERVAGHVLRLDRFPSIAHALERRRPVAQTEEQHSSEEGDPYDGVLDLPAGHSCMVVPLFASDRSLGIITLDRTTCQTYSPEVVQLAGVYGQIVSIAMLFAEQAELLERYRRQLNEEKQLLQQRTGGGRWAIRALEASLSSPMQHVVRLAKQVSGAELPVLISGETGTGKEVLAQAIHAWSPRAEQPFITLNCAALPENLVESELFGHVKGAFSGAAAERRGRFLTANGGTLLLDEIGDMSLATQAKLLRVLQEGTFEPVGADRLVRVDVRVLAASHVDLREAVREGRFREDLYYRLAGFPLELPPLRERHEDIAGIAGGVLESLARRTGRGPWSFGSEVLEALARHTWPGNVRELVNVLERAVILQPSGALAVQHILLNPGSTERTPVPPPADDPFLAFDDMQRAYFERAIERTSGKIYGAGGAAQLVGMKPTTLQSRLKKLGIDPADARG
ncbi:MAG: sigma-54-dependent Fis family transcriptional regulator [Nannocystales bacterium]